MVCHSIDHEHGSSGMDTGAGHFTRNRGGVKKAESNRKRNQ